MNILGKIGYPHLKKLDLAFTPSTVSISSEFQPRSEQKNNESQYHL